METQSRLQVSLGYLATIKPLIILVWHASPLFFICLFALTSLRGLIPLAKIVLTSVLLDTLVQALKASRTAPALWDKMFMLLILFGGVLLLGQLIVNLEQTIQDLYQTRVSHYVQLLIAEKTTSLDLAFFENPVFYERLTNASNEASYRPIAIISQLVTVASTLTTLVAVTAVLLLWQAWMVPILFIPSLLTFLVSVRLGSAHVDLVVGRTAIQRKADYLNLVITGDWAAKEIRLFSLGDFLIAKLRRLLNTMYRQDRKLAKRKMIYFSAVQTGSSVVKPLLLGFTAFEALKQMISIGQFNLYMQSILQMEDNLTILMLTLAGLHENNLFIANLFRFLALQPEVEAPRPDNALLLEAISSMPHIEFRGVSFHYPDTDSVVIKDLSFQVYPGERIALVGENGAGKTTIVKLLAGLYQPTGGQILFDGVDIKTLDRMVLRNYLSVIFQDYDIYHFSAYDNIGIGHVNQMHNCARVKDAARRSGIARIIEKLPHTYDTMLGRFLDFGHELSGGQRQLVALARALMRDAPILILDEPSAALDVFTEQRFFKRLLEENQTGDKQTVIFISHRFTTVHRADRIFVLENGKLIEQGSHDELMALQGRYAEMFNLQIQMYKIRS